MSAAPLRLGFLGVGWIGRHRMQALLESGLAEAAAIAEPSPDCLAEAAKLAPQAARFASLDELLEQPLDGVVIATPSAAHASQTIAALQRGLPVFCQKPLGRHAGEVAAVLEAAQAANRRLGVDLSYRHLAGMAELRKRLDAGALGRIYAMRLVFHNAYGPDKAWFYDRTLAGGGCVMDLGIHLVDLALWLLHRPSVLGVDARCYAGGRPLGEQPGKVEDYASGRIDLEGNISVELDCSWNLAIGVDAEIGMRIHGTDGTLSLRNVDGSFYDFVVEHFRGREREVLAEPPDAWGGRAALAWARALQADRAYDPSAGELLDVARVIDRFYAPT
ncbi:MAG TPA: Gfo/Idh/MocA family oxidoreductase [Rhodanobacteraceae bacterium]|nr:Gfo/Idh/MocA family oxidoreductase [Rhodanobacteraceae bacterium]